ncbi:glycoside hydrolase family 15 protein [Allokutzneria oryzae]|uniref:Glycoside hydrolase family 15 protein n=1 Tax=Allokutzneria oryzae TaxID=1378989 RepID=A0ABV6AAQ3_9PSEU
MSRRLEDYAVIGDTQSVALVGLGGVIDWLCLPRVDSDACFAALLGESEHGHWTVAPVGPTPSVRHRYRDDTLVLETEFTSSSGVVRLVDCMPIREARPQVLRMVEGVSGRVAMRSELALRFDYGRIRPWLRVDGRRIRAIAGPDEVIIDGDVKHLVRDGGCAADFTVAAGERIGLRLCWNGLRQGEPDEPDIPAAVRATEDWWKRWVARCQYTGDYRDAVVRSLITLKALSYAPSGAIAAAATTSLPEQLGGTRNFDYRYCWIRDATFTLLALLDAGYQDEAAAWREWLLRALAGQPRQLQIMYGVDGERRLPEIDVPWLPGYAHSTPVRIGNVAAEQFQLDVYGELMDVLHQARAHDLPSDSHAWCLQQQVMEVLESGWREPDQGLWEMRSHPRHYTYSKVMAWVGADRAVRAVEHFGLDGPLQRWKALREEISTDIMTSGYDTERRTFTQSYGSTALDAAVLLVPAVGFLPATDERMVNTVAALEHDLLDHGLLRRYSPHSDDGFPHGEGAFLACTFWLADNYILQGRVRRGRALFEQLLALRNDVGLLSEQVDPATRRLVGNIPQALSHVALVNTAYNLGSTHGPARRRGASRPRKKEV